MACNKSRVLVLEDELKDQGWSSNIRLIVGDNGEIEHLSWFQVRSPAWTASEDAWSCEEPVSLLKRFFNQKKACDLTGVPGRKHMITRTYIQVFICMLILNQQGDAVAI